MTSTPTLRPVEGEDAVQQAARILAWAFAAPVEGVRDWIVKAGLEHTRALDDPGHPGAVGATLLRIPMAQHFGGRAVPMVGIAGVGVSPRARGRGLATALMHAAVREMHADGVPLSTLYPATVPLYRRAGYEQAGHRFEIRMPLRPFRAPEARDGERERVVALSREADHARIEACYRRAAVAYDGSLDRSVYIWNRVYEPREGAASGWGIEFDGALEAYAFTIQTRDPDANGRHVVQLADVVATTARSARALLRMLAQFTSMGTELVLFGGPTSALLMHLREAWYTMTLRDHWMTRIVSVPGALRARGYAPGFAGDLHLEVHDPLLPDNEGRWVLRVRDGSGTPERGGTGSVRIHVRGLAAAYTGYQSGPALAGAGLADGPDRELRALSAAFGGGGTPWLLDMF